MYGLIGKLIALDGQREKLIAILLKGSRGMPGCLQYDVARDSDNPDAIWITEIWDSKASHENSLSLPGVLEAISRGKSLIAGFGERFETEPVSMHSIHKPAGYNSVSPYLVVADPNSTVAFLKSVFGAVELRRFEEEDGRVTHVEIRIDDTVVMMGQAGGEFWPPVPAHMHVYVRDVDMTYELARQSGAESVQEPDATDDGDRRAGVKGPGGVIWWISTQSTRP